LPVAYGKSIGNKHFMKSKQLNFEVIEIKAADQLCRKIIADLPEYFGIPEANEHYAEGVNTRINFAAQVNNDLVGLLSLEFTYPNNANIYWMAVMRKNQRSGVGAALIEKAEDFAKNKGATSITVETLAPAECDENYLKTYHFYQHCGFKPLFNLKPAGYEWNMVYMCKAL
jgi:GNAT superfamily N-acetyltransferase